MLRNKKLVCFDLDGTLIDSVGVWNQVDAQLIQDLSGHTINLQNIQAHRDTQLKKYKHCVDPYLEYCGYLKESYGISNLSKEDIKIRRYAVSHYFLDHVIQLKPQADQFVQKLAQHGIQTAITTTTSINNIQRYQHNNAHIHQKLDFNRDFSLILTRENVQNIKPHPEIYLKAIEHFNVQPEECLIIEDSLIGVESANQAGIEVVAIYDQYSEHELEQIKAKANFFARDFSELIAAL
ncbi:HAD family hydrolase [Acinetobacter sp. ANC 3813]|uniref:HAD family hydrolase n=1 Tax=Acinetobacter sp. ANC 3813 TaxID=1977873 RepID=UPI000A338399|nr:HAD family phosphatase [Acinetobacter sp. ANC 3813]OTG88791.1 haloacid dehalogenase [Acinetobacter sp. ANC 3813]